MLKVNPMTILKTLREVNNYTQLYVGEEILGIGQNTYSRLESNPKKITAEQAQKLSELYGVSISVLLTESTPIIHFKDSTIETINNSTQPDKNIDHEIEIARLREEVYFLRKLSSDLLNLLERCNPSGK